MTNEVFWVKSRYRVFFQNLEFHGVMRFYFQDSGQKIATKCIRVASDATVSDVIGKKQNFNILYLLTV